MLALATALVWCRCKLLGHVPDEAELAHSSWTHCRRCHKLIMRW